MSGVKVKDPFEEENPQRGPPMNNKPNCKMEDGCKLIVRKCWVGWCGV
jgi:hypothetical protein